MGVIVVMRFLLKNTGSHSSDKIFAVEHLASAQ